MIWPLCFLKAPFLNACLACNVLMAVLLIIVAFLAACTPHPEAAADASDAQNAERTNHSNWKGSPLPGSSSLVLPSSLEQDASELSGAKALSLGHSDPHSAAFTAEPLVFTLSHFEAHIEDEAFTPYFSVVGRIECEGNSTASCTDMDDGTKLQVWLDYQVSGASIDFMATGRLWTMISQDDVNVKPSGEFALRLPLPRHDLTQEAMTFSMNVVGWVPLFTGYLQMALVTPVQAR
ncbi:MAG: hypothetical protein P8077_05685, partial [Gammaproteobacteria bacterium]